MNFLVNKKKLSIQSLDFQNKIIIHSGIKNYNVFLYDDALKLIKSKIEKNDIVIIDKFIYEYYFSDLKNQKKVFVIKSSEKIKTLKMSNKIIDFFIKEKVTKLSKVFAVGGGIIQDLVGYSCYVYKRGIPWVYIPTTMLGITDSCVGGKVALNYKDTKNLCALFSAPKTVIISLNFIDSLKERDYLSGIGEAFRLHITGGEKTFNLFDKEIHEILIRNKIVVKKMIYRSLIIKKSIVEYDEYENDIRRSMNFGHSIGHAYEPMLNFKIPHGLAIALGICIELILLKNSVSEKMLNKILFTFKKIFPTYFLNYIENLDVKNINSYLFKDKKTLGNILKIAVPIKFGQIEFISKKLDNKLVKQIYSANKYLLSNYQ